jgi:hypothetical protein
LGFDDIIRFRGVVSVEDAAGERRKAKEWLGTAGRMRVFRHARVTAQCHLVPVVVCVQDKAMKGFFAGPPEKVYFSNMPPKW